MLSEIAHVLACWLWQDWVPGGKPRNGGWSTGPRVLDLSLLKPRAGEEGQDPCPSHRAETQAKGAASLL